MAAVAPFTRSFVGVVSLALAVMLALEPLIGTQVPLLAFVALVLLTLWQAHRHQELMRAEAQRVARRMAFLAEASRVLSTSLEYETTLNAVARLAVPELADACVVDMLGADGSIRRVAAAHLDPETERLARDLVREELLASLATDTGDLGITRKLGVASVIVVPLIARGRTIGALSFLSTARRRRQHHADLALARDLAHRAAFAVDNAALYREAQDANRGKDLFLAVLSHELRDPLNAIASWTHILRRTQPSEALTTRALETIDRNTKLLVQLIEDLLDVSRFVTGTLHLDAAPLDLVSVVEAAVEARRPSAEAKGITLETDLAASAARVRGEARRLQQVVGNLLSNAVKFTGAGGRIEVRLDRQGTAARLRVIDSGEGISPEFLPHVFDRFRQGELSLTRSGLGLGLAIARAFVELHGGTIRAESAGAHRGSTFTVTLPLA